MSSKVERGGFCGLTASIARGSSFSYSPSSGEPASYSATVCILEDESEDAAFFAIATDSIDSGDAGDPAAGRRLSPRPREMDIMRFIAPSALRPIDVSFSARSSAGMAAAPAPSAAANLAAYGLTGAGLLATGSLRPKIERRFLAFLGLTASSSGRSTGASVAGSGAAAPALTEASGDRGAEASPLPLRAARITSSSASLASPAETSSRNSVLRPRWPRGVGGLVRFPKMLPILPRTRGDVGGSSSATGPGALGSALAMPAVGLLSAAPFRPKMERRFLFFRGLPRLPGDRSGAGPASPPTGLAAGGAAAIVSATTTSGSVAAAD